MEELNTTANVETVEDKGHDTLIMVNLGDAVSLSQVSEDKELHNVIVSLAQLEKLMAFGRKVLA